MLLGLSANYQKCYKINNTLNAISSIITLWLCLLTHLNQNKDEHRDEVVRPGYSILIGQAEQVHNGGAHAQDTLHLISWGLIGIDGPDLSLCWGPRCLLQIHLHRFTHAHIRLQFSVFISNYILRCSANVYLRDLQSFVIGRHHFRKTLNVLVE